MTAFVEAPLTLLSLAVHLLPPPNFTDILISKPWVELALLLNGQRGNIKLGI